MGMDYKKANLAYFFMIITMFALVVYISFCKEITGKELLLPVNNVLCELAILVPALAITLYSGDAIFSVIPLKKIKISSALLSVLYVITLFPLVTFVNSFSMLFVDNAVVSISDQVVELPMWIMILSIGLFGPFVEEIVFRGVIFQSYRKSGRIVASMVLSSVLFGMMHLNFNQFAYGAVMGFMFCLMVEATGSVVPSFIAHAVFNTYEVIMIYDMDNSDIAEETANAFESMGEKLMMVSVLFVAAIIFTAISLCIVYKMAKDEGRRDCIEKLLVKRNKGDLSVAEGIEITDDNKKQTLFTFPLIIVMIFSISFMLYSTLIMKGI